MSATRILGAPLSAARRLRVLRWALATRLRMRWAGIRFDLDIGPDVVFYGTPKLRLVVPGRGGSLRVRIGENVRIREGLDIEVSPGLDSVLELDAGVRVYSNVALKLRGGSIKVGAGTNLREGVVVKAAGTVEMGSHCTISYYVVLHCTEAITLGDHVGLGERTSIIDSGHDVDGGDVPWTEQPVGTARVAVGRNTMVFSNVVIMRGVTLGRNTVVAAGSVVTGGEHPAGAVLLGAPARQHRIVEPPPSSAPAGAGQ
jgi:acetyltransferase-like isoleucine patch superfamily enzyme